MFYPIVEIEDLKMSFLDCRHTLLEKQSVVALKLVLVIYYQKIPKMIHRQALRCRDNNDMKSESLIRNVRGHVNRFLIYGDYYCYQRKATTNFIKLIKV